MMISHYAVITLYKCSIRPFVIKRLNINYHLFKYLFLVSFLDFLESYVVSFPFLLHDAFWDIPLQNTYF